jgi:glycosyltransferase involved in cell wall biosynthesis
MVIYGRLDTLTGGYLYDRFMVEALRRRGHQVELIPLESKPYARALLDNLRHGIASQLNGRPWDLLLQDALCHPSLVWINRRLHARRRMRIVAIVHQVLSRQPRRPWLNLAYRRIERAYLETTDGLLFASRFTRDAARELIGTDRPMLVAPPGGNRLGRIASERTIYERSHRSGPLDILFAGNLSPVKGLDLLLESLSRLPHSMWRLAVAGSLTANPRHARRIGDWLSSRGLESQVRLLGVVDGQNLAALYTTSQVFAMPFAHEGFGIAALEAMAFGLPVIGSTAGGVKEFVRHAENGFLVAAGDHAAVCRHLAGLHSDRGRLAAMGARALHTFSALPTWGQSMNRVCAFLEKVANVVPSMRTDHDRLGT